MARAIMTSITRISKESIFFSDLNNLEVVTTTSDLYADCFGFILPKIWCALDEYGLEDRKDKVRDWYDGFIFRQKGDIYNPWSIINYLKSGKFSAYWANTGSNSLVGKLIREGSPDIKMIMEDLLTGKELCTQLYEQIIFSQPEHKESAIRTLHIRK